MEKRPRGAPDVEAGEADAPASWTNLWQVPAIIASTVIILAGIYVAMRRAPDADFDGALSQVEKLIAIGDFELAGTQLNDVISPAIDKASNQQRARFNAIVGDWIMEAQAAAGHDLVTNAARANEHYSEAVRGGATLDR